ncbi:UNKNOWN [Stylonychia lemnae]|uniref:Serine aminopeptidase S33 domain-containing protein n=1 Tax=Stylonychia lemnae TaxID=5949 RepID=A0A078B5D4_STYLE|nr:UNKNOWN [Stylonychia lemnae]|eukprot:CDW89639.1 UNKNOWN [Stylonychia lemnae]
MNQLENSKEETYLEKFLKIDSKPFPISDSVDYYSQTSPDQIKLHYVEHPNQGDLKGVLFVFLGYGAYIDFYGNHFSQFASQGFRVFGLDREGFGKSGGERGVFGVDPLQDQIDFVDFIVEQNNLQDTKKYIFGVSLGALLSARMVQLRPQYFDGIIHIVPYYRNHDSIEVSGFKRFLLKSICFFNGYGVIARKSRTPEFDEFQSYLIEQDIDSVVLIRYKQVEYGLKIQDDFQREILKFTHIPLFVAKAEGDWVVSNEEIDRVYELNTNPSKQLVNYRGAIHAMMQQDGYYQQIVKDSLEWLQRINE